MYHVMRITRKAQRKSRFEAYRCLSNVSYLNERKILLNYNNCFFFAFKLHSLSMKKREISTFEDQFAILKIIIKYNILFFSIETSSQSIMTTSYYNCEMEKYFSNGRHRYYY